MAGSSWMTSEQMAIQCFFNTWRLLAPKLYVKSTLIDNDAKVLSKRCKDGGGTNNV